MAPLVPMHEKFPSPSGLSCLPRVRHAALLLLTILDFIDESASVLVLCFTTL